MGVRGFTLSHYATKGGLNADIFSVAKSETEPKSVSEGFDIFTTVAKGL